MSWTVMGSTGSVPARERALRALYEEQAGPLHSYVLRLLGGDRHKAEDVVQEALLRCWRTQDLEGDEPLRPWLFRVARNLVVDDYRLRMARPREVDGTAWLDDLLAKSDDIDRVLSSIVLKEAFRALSPKHREVLYETYYTGRSTREVALVLGIPPGTVKSRLYHAVRALRMALDIVETPSGEVAGKPAWAYSSAA
ncbi:sigma-70 family RNA polymerase sigma factor [Streptomyces sp. NBC_01808]|uniref:sigma-70 family RNA polymerase sigma factor n=1 Tax=Streptomyces sp. NBC_01808 TaxID=2975947 RepID=UPI002DDB5998|nr:sigma-70 family RNA polymerase sigma factor [Streptomyces sp. NBC_01808]WSA40272.1 sigma-70 family RNA polymerase sigma factor [Streptomyces sp. NBC_01808]